MPNDLCVKRHEIQLLGAISIKSHQEIEEIEFQRNIDSLEYEDMLDNIKGDGAAHVSVEVEFSDKTYGQGISLKVRVSLTCDQSLEGVETAYQYANQLAQDQLDSNIPKVRELYDQHIASKNNN